VSEVSPRSTWRLAAALVLVHAVVAAPLLFELRVRVPVYMKEFKEYNMALPHATQYFADASLWVAGPVSLLVVVAFLLVDGFFLWFMLQEHQTLAWAWFLAVVVLLLLLAGCAEWTMGLAQRKLHEALSRP
jgi:hypothetical protein